MELYTKDLVLRTVSGSDIEEVARMWKAENGSISLVEAQKAIDYMQNNHKMNKHGYIYHLCLAIFEKGTDKIIGWCGLDGKSPNGERTTSLFYYIDPTYRNKGYATQSTQKLLEYLFESVGLQRIDGGCYKENAASWRVMEKSGMVLFEYDEVDGGPHFYINKEIYLSGH